MSAESNPHDYTDMNLFFSQFVAVELPTPPVRIPPAFLPSPLLRAGKEPRRGESFPQDKLFRPASSALVVLIIWVRLEIVSNFVQQTP